MQTEAKVDTVYSLLGDECRRRTLRILVDASGTLTRTELARTLARNGYRSGSVEEIAISLHHAHLPKLADAGAIRYDTDAETIAITEDGERVLEFLDSVERKLTA